MMVEDSSSAAVLPPRTPSASPPLPLAGLEVLLEVVPAAVLVFDDAGIVVFANRWVEHVFGYLPCVTTGRPIEALLPTVLRAAVTEVDAEHAQNPGRGSTATQLKLQGLRKDATPFRADITLAPLTTPTGTYTAAIVNGTVVLPEGLSLEHLVISQHLARVGSWERDYVTGRVQWSPELYRILGVEPGTLEPGPETLYQHLHCDDRAMLRGEHDRAVREGGEVFAVVRAAGPPRTLAVRGSMELDERGRPARSVGTVQDISATTSHSPEPDSAADRLRATFDQVPIVTAPIGMAVVDVRPGRPIRRLTANQALADLTGLSPAELLQEPLENRVHPDDRASYLRRLSEVASGARDVVRSLEVRMVRPDGGQRWVAISGHLVRDGNGAPEYLVAHVQDISDSKHAELESRDRAARDARIASVLQGDLLPFVSHHVGTMHVASRYVPAGNGELVGGDWTDVFPLPNGRIGIVVGDVAGHGIEAAATMSRLRTVVRMLAASGLSPAGVLRRLNDSMHNIEIHVDTDLATVVHAQLDATTGILQYSSAGHVPMLVVSTERDQRAVVVAPVPAIGGPPCGVVPDQRYQEHAVRLEPGSLLIGFTDGLIEQRGTDLDESLLHLQDGLRHLPVSALSSVETLADAILDLAPHGATSDDLAIIVLADHPDQNLEVAPSRSRDDRRPTAPTPSLRTR
jgi:PAS domain S-box-containing protein